MSAGPPAFFWLLFAGGAFVLGIHGLRGVLALREALRNTDLRTVADPPGWRVTRAFCGLCAALPVLLLSLDLGYTGVLSALAVGMLGYAVAPRFLDSLRHGVESEVLADLALHLDVMALAAESGSSLPAALALATEHGPQGALRRAFEGVLDEVHAGVEPVDALRALDQRMGLRQFSTLVTALRSAERLGMPLAQVLRERATQSAANRFAQAERLARAAPLKLWATLVLCIAPCTLIVLAFPMARLLARVAGK